ncbi:MAG TPA: 2OG-Fe(II) oxygenase [Puia sp.]
MKERLEQKDWGAMAEGLHRDGYAVVGQVLTEDECRELIDGYSDEGRYRKTIHMERYRFGRGEYKYFGYPLPDLITTIRETVYPHLVPVANRWMEELGMGVRFPAQHAGMKALCKEKGQTKPTALILKYGEGGFNTLHQDLYGEVYFPMQVVLFLDEDYTGGEFVLTEQVPRAQSKASVVRPRRGDMLVFTTNFRPVKGSRGWYRVNMKHGVSPVRSGQRHTLGIIFHDAES